MAGELEAPEGHRFFQIKHGGIDVPTGGGGIGKRYTDAHIIGVVQDFDGNCVCRAWEEYERVTSPEFEAAEKVIFQLANKDDIERAQKRLAGFLKAGFGKSRWRLTEFSDNIQHMAYRNIGALSIDVQGLKV